MVLHDEKYMENNSIHLSKETVSKWKSNLFQLLFTYIIVWIINIANKIQKALKDGFDYDRPIIKNKPSKKMDKPKHFILSTEKIKRLGFTSKLGDDEIFSLMNHCKMKYQLVTQWIEKIFFKNIYSEKIFSGK